MNSWKRIKKRKTKTTFVCFERVHITYLADWTDLNGNSHLEKIGNHCCERTSKRAKQAVGREADRVLNCSERVQSTFGILLEFFLELV